MASNDKESRPGLQSKLISIDAASWVSLCLRIRGRSQSFVAAGGGWGETSTSCASSHLMSERWCDLRASFIVSASKLNFVTNIASSLLFLEEVDSCLLHCTCKIGSWVLGYVGGPFSPELPKHPPPICLMSLISVSLRVNYITLVCLVLYHISVGSNCANLSRLGEKDIKFVVMQAPGLLLGFLF